MSRRTVLRLPVNPTMTATRNTTSTHGHGNQVPVDHRTRHLSNATLFNPKEAFSHQIRQFHRLKKHQRDIESDRADTNIKKRTKEQYKHEMILCLGSQMELNDSQIWRARCKFLRLDVGDLGMLLELVALCVLLRVMKTDADDDEKQWSRTYHPNQGPDNRDNVVHEVVESLKSNYSAVTDGNIIKVYNRLAQNPATREGGEWEPLVHHEGDTLLKPREE